jgi:hypothetical protein
VLTIDCVLYVNGVEVFKFVRKLNPAISKKHFKFRLAPEEVYKLSLVVLVLLCSSTQAAR